MSLFRIHAGRATLALVAPIVLGCTAGASPDTARGGAALDAAPAASAVASQPAVTQVASGPEVTIYKSPTCGCCHIWMNQMQAEGFKVVVRDTSDVEKVNRSLHVPESLAACHTSVVEGMTIVGHVPPDLVRKFLAERPAGAAGIGVPGMPEGAMTGTPGKPFDVLVFDHDGKTRVYATR